LKDNIIRNPQIDEYINNINFGIKGYSQERLVILRNEIIKAQQQGKNIVNIRDIVKNELKVSKSKAEFIATQENKLFASLYQEKKFTNIGLDQFRWIHTDPNSNRTDARKGHVMLFERSNAGEIFSFKNPPKDPITGRRVLPGQEYNCHCIAGIILDNKKIDNILFNYEYFG
jgi:uncharacterized protein with gpF-like domain